MLVVGGSDESIQAELISLENKLVPDCLLNLTSVYFGGRRLGVSGNTEG